MDLPSFRDLLSPLGQETLRAAVDLQSREEDFLRNFTILSRRFPAHLSRVALATAILRAKAVDTFAQADRQYFTREALEQASPWEVARNRSQRYQPFAHLADLGCSVGGDTLALGSIAPTIGVDVDPMRTLGREISLRLAADKATVVVGSRYPQTNSPDKEQAAKAREELAAADATLSRMRRFGGRALWVNADVSRPESVHALLREARNRFGRVDVLVNNAGAGGNFVRVGEVMRDHRENFASVLAANFLGAWEAMTVAREIMRMQEGGGAIVNVATHYADHPYLFRTIYTVSKILLKALAQAAREGLAVDGISVADVAPSITLDL